jgi:hypothetical protein
VAALVTAADCCCFCCCAASQVLLLYFGDRYAAAAAGGPANASYVYLPLVAGDAADTLQLVYVPSVRLSDYRQVAVSV